MVFLLSLLAPQRCLGCNEIIENKGLLCIQCWCQTQFISEIACRYCGLINKTLSEQKICMPCSLLKKRHPLSTRSALAYEGWVASIIGRFKFGNGAHLAKPLSRFLAGTIDEIAPKIDLIIPIPMHWTSMLKRRYNQASLLALHVAKFHALPISTKALMKIKHTQRQRSLKRSARIDNVHGSFQVKDNATVQGKTIMLIDDIITTGATMGEACATLLKEGAKEVHIVSLARKFKN